MKALRRFLARLAGMVPKSQREQEFSEELESHLSMATEDKIREGCPPEEARRAAILQLGGGIELTKQRYRESGTLPLVEDLLRDLGFALRQLRRGPGFAVTAVLMLALGTAASVSIFAFVDAALLKPLPYTDPGRLVGVFESIALGPHFNLSYLDYLDWKRENTVFTSLDVYQRTGFVVNTATGIEAVRGARVSDGFFTTLGVTPVLGRTFAAGEDLPSASRTVLLSYAAWQQRYGGRSDVLGQTVMLDRKPATIIGVLPRSFQFAPVGSAEMFATLHANGSCDLRRSCHDFFGVARLKPGVTFAAASADVVSVAAQLEKRYPQDNRGQSASLLPLSEYLIGDIRPILVLLLAGAGLLLLIACVNIASLLLVRTQSRMREIAMRSALGASPTRIVRQFITEALVIVLSGSAIGLGLAAGAMRLLMALIPARMLANMPYLTGLGLNVRVLLFASLIGLGCLIVFSVTPTLRLPLHRFSRGLAEGGRGSAGMTWRRLGSHLVVLELATAMVLLVGAGLLAKSFHRLLHVELGFRPDHVATLSIAASPERYGKDPQAAALATQIIDRVGALPGVRSASISSGLPIGGNGSTEWIRILGRPWHGEHLEMVNLEVSSGYFQTLGGTLLRGRFFTEDDKLGKPRVAIINQTFARVHFPNEDPIGQRLAHTSVPDEPAMEIVGVVDDLRESSLDEPNAPVLYFPFAQSTETFVNLLVRTTQEENAILPALVAAVHGIDPDLILEDPGTMTDRIVNSPSAYLHRSVAYLVGAFAALAMLLGVVGLYGVVAYSVSQRTREIGVRMALGAQRGMIYRLIFREAGSLAVAGIVGGIVCSIAAATLMRKLLFGVHAWDISTLLSVALLLGSCSVVASFVPARRAAGIDPVEALRAE